MLLRLARVAVCAALLASLVPAQEPVKIRTETNAVQIDVAVRDGKGRTVPDLSKDNFKIKDEGKPRPIDIFGFNRGQGNAGASTAPPPVAVAGTLRLPTNVFTNRNSAPPPVASHSTVILLDGANGWFDNFGWAQQAVIGLLDKVAADERIAVYAVTIHEGLVVVQDYTNDHGVLLASVRDYVTTGLCPAPPGMEDMAMATADRPIPILQGPSCPGVPPAKAAGAPPNRLASEQAFMRQRAAEDVRLAFNALATRLASIPGRKSVFWLTQGFPPSEIRSMSQAWDKTFTALNQANVAVNTVDSNRLGGPVRLRGPGVILTMQQVAERTGGQAYVRRNDLDEAMAEGIAAARDSYTLGFYLSEGERDGKFHHLAVSTDVPHLDLQYRQGYYAGAWNPNTSQKKMPLESAVLSPLDLPAIGITAEIAVEPGRPRATLRVQMNLDLAALTLKQVGDIWSGKLEEMFMEFNQNGGQLAKVSDTREFRIPESKREQYQQQGLVLTQNVALMDGATRLSIIVRDTATGQIGSLNVPLAKLPK